MHKTWNGGSPTPAFNNAAQVVNHTFFWESMAPNAGGERGKEERAGSSSRLGLLWERAAL